MGTLLAFRTNMLASLDHQWVDGVAGVRSQLCLSPKYSVTLNGEVDGFFNDRMTYDATGWVKFHWTKEFSLSLGYRYSRFSYEAGHDQRYWAYEGEPHGVIAALELAFVYLFEGDEEDMHRAFLTRFAVDGNETEGATRYTWTPIYYNAPLYKKWIYYEIGPEVLWHRKERWEPVPAIRFGVTAHFWGTAER